MLNIKKLLVAASFAAACGSAVAVAVPLRDFTLDLTAVSTSLNNALVADKFTGNYNEMFSVTSFNPITNTGTFATTAYWDMGQIVYNDGATAYNAGTSRLGVDYSIYGLFDATGSFAPNASGGFSFISTAGSLGLWLDQLLDSNPKVLPGSAPGSITVPNTGDDSSLASSALKKGEGNTSSGLANGDFGLVFEPFNLTTLGSSFFVEPIPFYMTVVLKGQFNSFDPAAIQNQPINGSADANFVPEPGTLALLGLGLLGFSLMRRQKS